jgi:CubicO group peptidase (beta-lactamase class C family)
MNPITRRQALAVGAVALPLGCSANLATGDRPDAELDDLIDAALKAWDVPGAAVGIVREGQITYLRGHGVKKLGGNEPVTPDTLFAIASCTKAFTTTAIAMLVATGKMYWDQAVRAYLEYFRLADPSADRLVTLRDLVCHRTGLGTHDLLWYRAAWSPRDAVRRIGRVQPDLQFRSSFQYQSTMVAAAGFALEAALGKGATWEGFVRENILEPLGMKRTYFTTKEAFAEKDRATPHREDRAGKLRPIDWYETKEPDPAGSIVSCARDLCQWAMFHLRQGKVVRNDKEATLVPEQALAETHTAQNLIPLRGADKKLQPETHNMTYCMGWVRQDYRGELLLSHGGTIDGFRTHITLAPNRNLGIVLLNNRHGTDMNLALSNTLLDYLLDLPGRRHDWHTELGIVAKERDEADKRPRAEREKKRHPHTKPSRELEAYTGTYLEPAFGVARVTLKGDKLVWSWSTFECPLEHFHFDTFVAPIEILHDPFVSFGLGLDGQVVTMNAVERYFVRVK